MVMIKLNIHESDNLSTKRSGAGVESKCLYPCGIDIQLD